jgi:deoxycytidylate deaminase
MERGKSMTIDLIPTGFEFRSWVQRAAAVAMNSPCQSKRGVVISSIDGSIVSEGYNHQPFPFRCDGSDRCKSNCGKTAIHAEQSAILNAKQILSGFWMIHVKAKGGIPRASMAPSCLECSKLIVESGISWMFLLHDPAAQILPGAETVGQIEGYRSDGSFDYLDIRRYGASRFHWLTAEYSHRIELLPAAVQGKEERP